ncbi:hypothetical protein AAP_03891 [Ascosphaera apis ARSEF 7405]|uniref:Uncharacterized protein n=1 Tax=Ascosphaera apis ARSEF 7405 TaxID=392613 RepID=A0A167XQX0_9EURO|nr:hypothetical protein AAP_03891 [Ascosphaera apis ARSEF 7405]
MGDRQPVVLKPKLVTHQADSTDYPVHWLSSLSQMPVISAPKILEAAVVAVEAVNVDVDVVVVADAAAHASMAYDVPVSKEEFQSSTYAADSTKTAGSMSLWTLLLSLGHWTGEWEQLQNCNSIRASHTARMIGEVIEDDICVCWIYDSNEH